MNLTNIGYYLLEAVPRPDYISLPCEKVLSVSHCICDAHPVLTGCFWVGYAAEKAAYRQRLALTESAFEEMQAVVLRLFEANLLDTDGRFLHLADAIHFYQMYLGNLAEITLVGVSSAPEYIEALVSDGCWGHNAPCSLEPVTGELLGGEILGFDIASFESYLCNSLDKTLTEQWPVLCDRRNGLLQNTFAELEKFSETIAGMGEPVDWMPFLLHDCTPHRKIS